MRLSFPPKDEIFYDWVISGKRYVAAARGDLYVTDGDGHVQLGHAARVLNVKEAQDRRFIGPGWYVCKYGPGEIRFALPFRAESEASLFAETFGMSFNCNSLGINFWESAAGTAAVAYFQKYPRRTKRCSWNYVNPPEPAR
jgi:hypothetical protein